MKAGFYVRVDMPGVTKEMVSVRVKDGCVLFADEAGMDSNQVESDRGILLLFPFSFFLFFFQIFPIKKKPHAKQRRFNGFNGSSNGNGNRALN